MTILDVFLIVIFLMVFPILSIFFFADSPSQYQNLCDNFDLNPNKKTVYEHINNLPRKKDIEDSKKKLFSIKSFTITFIVVLLLLLSPFIIRSFIH